MRSMGEGAWAAVILAVSPSVSRTRLPPPPMGEDWGAP